jgi:hypothetical protein
MHRGPSSAPLRAWPRAVITSGSALRSPSSTNTRVRNGRMFSTTVSSTATVPPSGAVHRTNGTGGFSPNWLVNTSTALSRLASRSWTFKISGVLIAASFVNMYYIAPRLERQACSPENPDACEAASRFSEVILWISATIYGAGFFVAFLLGPILTRFDRS